MGWGQRWKILISCGFTGKSIFKGGVGEFMKKTIFRANCLKREDLAKKGAMYFMLDSNH